MLEASGFSAVLVENFHDAPFTPGRVEPETVAAMALAVAGVRRAVSIPVGVNVLRNDGLSALGVAAATGASFVRVNVLAGSAVTDQGVISGDAYNLQRRRAALGAEVAVLADVDVKHARSLDNRPVGTRAKELVQRALADAVLVTGNATGEEVDRAALANVVDAVAPTPVLAASGADPGNVSAILEVAAGVIVGTALEDPSTGRIDPRRAAAFRKACP